MILFGFLSLMTTSVAYFLWLLTGIRQVKYLKLLYCKRLLCLDTAFYVQNPPDSLIKQYNQDINDFQIIVLGKMEQLMQQSVSIVTCFVIILMHGPMLGILTLSLTPVFILSFSISN